jgi:hypothetical protein
MAEPKYQIGQKVIIDWSKVQVNWGRRGPPPAETGVIVEIDQQPHGVSYEVHVPNAFKRDTGVRKPSEYCLTLKEDD